MSLIDPHQIFELLTVPRRLMPTWHNAQRNSGIWALRKCTIANVAVPHSRSYTSMVHIHGRDHAVREAHVEDAMRPFHLDVAPGRDDARRRRASGVLQFFA